MDNMKFIARYAASAAILAGLSTQAFAFDVCPLTVQCDPGHLGPNEANVPGDTTGIQQVNDVPTAYDLSVNKFDPNVWAAIEGTTPDKIILKGAEVKLTIETTEFLYRVNNDSANDCDFFFSYEILGDIQADASLGTDPLTLPNNYNVPAPGVTIPAGTIKEWTLADFPNNDPLVEGCTAVISGANLANWIGAGQVSWPVTVSVIRSSDGCGFATVTRRAWVRATVTVKYLYCVEDVILTPGCPCESPSPNYRNPGSLLLFPEFDNEGDFTILTVTNTDCFDEGADGGDIDIEFMYIDGDNCSEFNATETLTPCDTLSVLTNFHAPGNDRGYVYVFAKDRDNPDQNNPNGRPVSWNHLIGQEVVISGVDAFDYAMNAVVFKSRLDDRVPTDRDHDGVRDLDEIEYEAAPNSINIPRFFGQDGTPGNQGNINSELILIGLSGGARFSTTVCFEGYNDNEVPFSTEYTFDCWDKVQLLDISLYFANSWLKNNTIHDPDEVVGAPSREAGWFCVQGCVANSDQESIRWPAIYATLVEHIGPYGVADLPWECGRRTNGALLPTSMFGDGDIDIDGDGAGDPVDGDNQ